MASVQSQTKVARALFCAHRVWTGKRPRNCHVSNGDLPANFAGRHERSQRMSLDHFKPNCWLGGPEDFALSAQRHWAPLGYQKEREVAF